MFLPNGFFFFDSSYIIYVLPALLLTIIAQWRVQSTFNKYSRIMCLHGFTGEMVARRILDSNGLYYVKVVEIQGKLTDHYDPTQRVVSLSSPVFNSSSVASIGVAAHETGHAIQHSVSYKPLKLRNTIIPVTQVSSSISIWIFIAGIMFASQLLALFGIILFSVAVLFQLLTLPVEFNASSRALKILETQNILYDSELDDARRVLRAAAMTYVAALLLSLGSLLRLLVIFGGMRRRD